jgi:hypothetical protein
MLPSSMENQDAAFLWARKGLLNLDLQALP